MATQGWGLERERAPKPERRRGVPVPPQAAHAAHKGIVWLHASAIGIWLIVLATLGAVALAGRPVPPIVLIIGCAAAAGHALFLGAHVLLARQARKRTAAAAP